jgi:hypothetical protein
MIPSILVTGNPHTFFMLFRPEAVLHAVLSTRMLLHLRSIGSHDSDGVHGGSDKAWGAAYNSVGREDSMGNGPSQISTIRFA